ncbi:hypothetical protein D3C76_1310540 [compost metagenome]
MSPRGEAVRPWATANPTTSRLPSTEKTQNTGRGRSPARKTPNTAVASGSRPTNTME